MAGARGKPTPRSNPFEYEVHNAEPRATTYKYTTRPAAPQRETTKVYPQQQRPSSYEDVVYEEPIRQAKKSASYESADRDRKSSRRDEERARDARREEDERARQKWEKEAKRSAHGEKKKKEDKAKRRAGEEKHSTRAAYFEEEVDSDEYRASRSREKARQERERHRIEEEIHLRNEEAQAQSRADAARKAARETESRQAPLTPKWDDHKEYAAQYMQAARRKAAPVGTADDFRPRPMERAQTFAAPAGDIKYNIRYAEPRHAAPLIESDDELPRRSSASRTHRKSAETPPSRSSKETTKSSSKEKPREKEREKESRKKSGRSRSRDPYIVSPPSPPLAPLPKQKPSLQTHSSAPPIVPVSSRREPSRSKTQDYPREAPPPTLPRASTFQSGDRAPADRGTRGSRLKKTVDYTSGSDSDSPVYTSNRHSHSPPPQSRRREAPEPTRYIIDNGRSVPVARAPHRAEMRGIDDEVPYLPRERERSESPHGTSRHPRASERPPVTRAPASGGTRQAPARSHSQAYYPPPEAPEPVPVIMTARPKMPPRESSHGHTSSSRVPRGSAGVSTSGYFGEVSYGKQVRPEDVIYNDAYRRGSDPTHHPHAAREYAYATPLPRDARVYA